MTKRNLPLAPVVKARPGVQCDISPKAMDLWNPSLQAVVEDDADNTISIYDPIGYDWWTGQGVTAKRIDAALRNLGRDTDVVVNINSPGGDVFEGLAIYNLFRQHKGHVTMNVIGLAASAASFIAMGGDTTRIGRAAFLMVHNAWLIAAGNRHEFRAIADWLEPFDATIAEIYAARTGLDESDVIQAMDDEAWIRGRDAVEGGWIDAYLEADEVETSTRNQSQRAVATRRLDAAMAKAGIPRSERKALLNDFKSSMRDAAGGGKPGATATDMPGAVAPDLSSHLQSVASILDTISGDAR